MLSSRINSKTIVISLSVLLLLYFVIFPMGILLFDSVVKDGAINLENYRNVYSADVNWKALTSMTPPQFGHFLSVSSIVDTVLASKFVSNSLMLHLCFNNKANCLIARHYHQTDLRTPDRTSEDSSDLPAPIRTCHTYKAVLLPASWLRIPNRICPC